MSATLKEAVGNAIALRSPPLALLFMDACADPQEHASEVEQIRVQNTFWRRQFEALEGIDTTALREYLVECDECAQWLRLFHTGILPAIVGFALPRESHYVRT